jgi:hypothetical protein
MDLTSLILKNRKLYAKNTGKRKKKSLNATYSSGVNTFPNPMRADPPNDSVVSTASSFKDRIPAKRNPKIVNSSLNMKLVLKTVSS